MRRELLIVVVVIFFIAWFAGSRLPQLAAIVLNAAVLIHFELATLRRLILTISATLRDDRPPRVAPDAWPKLTVLVPCRNEEAVLPDTLSAWEAVEYPRARLQVIFIDDASDDGTGELLSSFARQWPWAQVLRLDAPSGAKGAALHAGLDAAAPSEAVAVFDADARPRPECLQWLAAHLGNPAAAAVAGRMIPDDHRGAAAVYSALESSVHQRITLTGASRIGATVPLLGSAYLVRRPLLDALGFSPDHRLEDIDLSVRLLERNFRIIFEPLAICDHRPPANVGALMRQRTAWSRGFHRIVREHALLLINHADGGLLAIDRALFAAGYLDRLSFLCGVALAVLDATVWPALWMPWWAPVIYAGVIAAQIPLALFLDNWPGRKVLRLLPALGLVLADLLTETVAALADAIGLPQRWTKTARAGEEPGDG